jgi:LEA14-like dessication related protein
MREGRTGRRATIVALLAVGAGMAGCIPGFRQPEVHLETVRLGSIGLSGATLVARLHVINPNGYRLETSSLTYNLELADDTGGATGWVPFASGTFAEPIEVAGRDSARVELPIDLRFDGLSRVARSVLDRGTLDYRVSGIVEVRRPLRRNVPYRRTGRVSLTE